MAENQENVGSAGTMATLTDIRTPEYRSVAQEELTTSFL